MASRSLNKVLLIGNLTRDPELRYTPQGTAVCTFGLATNRSWTTEDNQKHEDTEFHNIVCWNRLAEIVAEYLNKGKQVYVEGRLSTREWEGQDGVKRRTTEIVANEVIFLGSAGGATRSDDLNIPDDLGLGGPSTGSGQVPLATSQDDLGVSQGGTKPNRPKSAQKSEVQVDESEDIPF